MGAAADGPLTLDIRDYLALPITGKLDGTGQTDGMLARVNSFREEPGGTNRFFLHDLNGPLYIFDAKSKALTVYLDLNGRNGRPGVFHKLSWEVGYANGLMSFQFDPDYRANGKFYTVHIEEPAVAALEPSGQHQLQGLERRRLCGHRADRDAGADPARRHPGRVDRYQPVQRDLRRHRARADADSVQYANPSARRPAVQPGGASRRQRMAGALPRVRRRRRGRIVAPRHPQQPAAARHDGGKDPEDHSRPGRTSIDERGQRQRPLPDSERQPVSSQRRAPAKRSGHPDFATPIACTGRSIRPIRRTTG